MPKFSLPSGMDFGTAALSGGIGSLIQAFASAPLIRQKALREEQSFQAELAKNQALAEQARSVAQENASKAEINRKRSGYNPLPDLMQERGIPTNQMESLNRLFSTGSTDLDAKGAAQQYGLQTPGQQAQMLAAQEAGFGDQFDLRKVSEIATALRQFNQGFATESKVNQISDAAKTDEDMRMRQAVVDEPSLGPRVAQAYASTSGTAPFDAVGTTGYAQNKFTGEALEANPALAGVFRDKTNSETTKNLRENSGASNRQVVTTGDGHVVIVDKATGQTETVMGANGAPLTGKGGGMKPLTESQAKAQLFGGRMMEAEKVLSEIEGKGVYSTGVAKNIVTGAVGIVNDNAAEAAGSALRFTMSDDQKKLDQAQRDFINATLRRESGAVISPVEFANGQRQYFPQVGDPPDLIAQKRRNRELATKLILSEVPEGQRFRGLESPQSSPPTAPTAPQAPQPFAPQASARPQLGRAPGDSDTKLILQREIQTAMLRLEQARSTGDEEVINRALQDVAALNREMQRAGLPQQQPAAQPQQWGGEGRRSAPAQSSGWSIRKLD